MEKNLAETRRGQASHGHNSQPRDIQKATRTTQSKLDQSRARFNEQMKINSQLRKDIEMLHMQRTRFQQLYRKLEKVLQDMRKDIAEVVDKSATAYDAKVDAQTKTTMIKEKVVKDLAQYSAEMQELERVIAHEHQLKEFMTTKNNRRANMDSGKKTRRRQEMKEQRKADGVEETPDSLRKAFQQIQELTGEDHLGKLVTKFIQGEANEPVPSLTCVLEFTGLLLHRAEVCHQITVCDPRGRSQHAFHPRRNLVFWLLLYYACFFYVQSLLNIVYSNELMGDEKES
ncbi:coiled-coil domain-containing protein 63-like [Sinocyclocheilus grahami]|uniref:coiled-coil domain-containing protein 63-like n=1 Tax=Sinocyclocheilus grahami TaxID=75366 RepID=UPI0007AC8DE2|nr:PREDICTED: coiled-coil domain-containing protein 63-like [Sinocyclocheilus grahami]